MESATPAFISVAMAIVAIGGSLWNDRASRRMVEDWVFSNGFMLVKIQWSPFGGPFWWRTSKYQTVYKFTVVDSNGQTQIGWARCGSWFFGILSNEIAVEWKER